MKSWDNLTARSVGVELTESMRMKGRAIQTTGGTNVAHVADVNLRKYALAIGTGADVDINVESHLMMCESCRERLDAELIDVGASSIGKATDSLLWANRRTSAIPLEADEFSGLIIESPGSAKVRQLPYKWFRTPDRPGIIRDLTQLGRAYSVNFTEMIAIAVLSSRKGGIDEAYVGFRCEGLEHDVIDLENDLAPQLEAIKQHHSKRISDPVAESPGEVGLIVKGQDRENAVVDFVDTVSLRCRARMRCFSARAVPETQNSEFKKLVLECRVVVTSDVHARHLRRTLGSWQDRHGLVVMECEPDVIRTPTIADITREA